MIVDYVNTAYIKLGFEPSSSESNGSVRQIWIHVRKAYESVVGLCSDLKDPRIDIVFPAGDIFFFLLVQSPHELCNPSSLLSSVYGGMGGLPFFFL